MINSILASLLASYQLTESDDIKSILLREIVAQCSLEHVIIPNKILGKSPRSTSELLIVMLANLNNKKLVHDLCEDIGKVAQTYPTPQRRDKKAEEIADLKKKVAELTQELASLKQIPRQDKEKVEEVVEIEEVKEDEEKVEELKGEVATSYQDKRKELAGEMKEFITDNEEDTKKLFKNLF